MNRHWSRLTSETAARSLVRMRHIVLLAVLIAGCGSDAVPTRARGSSCAERSGLYSLKFSERSGTCGAMPEQVVSQGAAADGGMSACTGGTTFPDTCTAEVDSTCPGATGYSVTMRGRVEWSADGRSGTGVFQLLIARTADGWTECSSTYDAVYSRL